ncbi:MAG: type III pantothenate kinase [Gammaproteobacteria bacterium]|nr:type III pantothenate kinase [Gammaproteobacteria bacterium]
MTRAPLHLLVDIGNTRIKWSFGDMDRLTLDGSQALLHRDETDLTAQINQLWSTLQPPTQVWVSNVAGSEIENQISNWVQLNWGVKALFIKEISQLPRITSQYSLGTIGVDRWMALLGLYGRYSLPAIVIDCGTAITADILVEGPIHLGGVIMPGFVLMRESLKQGAKALPVVADCNFDGIGGNTIQAISSGLLNAVAGMVQRLAAQVEGMGCPPPQLVLSGGDAGLIAPVLGGQVEIDPDLVLYGIQQYVIHNQYS